MYWIPSPGYSFTLLVVLATKVGVPVQLFLESTGFGLVVASILAISAVGFTLQWGVGKFINLAYVDFMVLAAYLDYTFTQTIGLEFWLGAVLSVVSVAILMVLMNQYLVQPLGRRGVRLFDLLVVGFGVGAIVEYTIQAIYGTTFFHITVAGNTPLNFAGLKLTASELVIIGIAVMLMLLLHILLSRTDLGRAIRAVSVNPTLAQSCGVRIAVILNASWFLSGLMCGLAGLVLAFNTAVFNSGTAITYFPYILAVAMVGGIGSAYGAMAAAVLVGLVSEWVSIVNPYFGVMAALVAAGLVALFRPEGLFRSPMAGLGGSV
jgi:neutral amino acid transport system permease protein